MATKSKASKKSDAKSTLTFKHAGTKKSNVRLTIPASRKPKNNPEHPSDSAVNHPKHYNNNPSGIECIDVVVHLPFNVGSAMKYLWRYNDKGNPIQDLEKAIWYAQREIERIKTKK